MGQSTPPPAPEWPREAQMEEGCLLDKYPILSACLLNPRFANPALRAALCTGHLWEYTKHEVFVYFSGGSANKPATVHSLQDPHSPPQPGEEPLTSGPVAPSSDQATQRISSVRRSPKKWAGAP